MWPEKQRARLGLAARTIPPWHHRATRRSWGWPPVATGDWAIGTCEWFIDGYLVVIYLMANWWLTDGKSVVN